MVVSILPVYLMFQAQVSPAAVGLIEGLYQGSASLVRLATAVVTDRLRRYKELAIAGYAASAFAKLGFLLAGTHAAGLGAVVLADRLGKGIRTSPRDALISFNATPQGLGAAFGVHRALDTTGAVLGPLVAFALLRQAPQAYDAVFVTSFAIALVGVAVLAVFVRNPAERAGSPPPRRVRATDRIARLRRPRAAGRDRGHRPGPGDDQRQPGVPGAAAPDRPGAELGAAAVCGYARRIRGGVDPDGNRRRSHRPRRDAASGVRRPAWRLRRPDGHFRRAR